MSNFFAAIHSGFNNLTHSAEHLMIIFAIFLLLGGCIRFYQNQIKLKIAKNNILNHHESSITIF